MQRLGRKAEAKDMTELVLKFEGTFNPRSSERAGGPPGEAELLRYNPKRRQKLLQVTGWTTLEPGSLNLYDVDNSKVDELLTCKALYEEVGREVIYPYQRHIPSERGTYYYYAGIAGFGGKVQQVLVRRALNPPHAGLVELFAPVSLMQLFGLKKRNRVEVEVIRYPTPGKVWH
jgi:hypothetical protein